MKNIYFVKRQQGDVLVSIMYNRTDKKYHFVNLSKGHICSCGFETINDAILDMEHYKNNGMIDAYYCILGE